MLHLDHQFLRAAGETSRNGGQSHLGAAGGVLAAFQPVNQVHAVDVEGFSFLGKTSAEIFPVSNVSLLTWAYWFFYPVGNTWSQLPWLLLWLMQCFMWLRFLFFWHILLKKYPQIFWHLMVLWRLFEIQMECWRAGFIIVYLILW